MFKSKRILIFALVVVLVVGLFNIGLAEQKQSIDVDEAKQGIATFLDTNAGDFTSTSDAIWSYAELGFQEFKSSEAIKNLLEKYGFDVELGVAGMPTAIVASWGSGSPVVGFIGEYDALPGLSQKAVSHKEPVLEGAPGHGCGHNIYGATGAAGAIALKNAMEEYGLKGTVKFFGSPAEEAGSGKVYMVREGLFDGVDAVLTSHPGSSFRTSYGVSGSALLGIIVTYHGKSVHAGSAPWEGISALDAANIMGISMEFLREHLKWSYRMHYIIQEGGTWPNIVPDKAKVILYVRDNDERIMDTYKKFLRCVEAGAIATGCTYDLEFFEGTHQKIPNEALAKLIFKNMKLVGLPEWTAEEQAYAKEVQKNAGIEEAGLPDTISIRVAPDVCTGGGSSDEGDVSIAVPLAGLSTPCKPKGVPGHSWGVVATGCTSIAHKGLIAGAKAIACTGLDILTDPKVLKEIKDEFDEMHLKIPPYECLTPELDPTLELATAEMARWRSLMEPYYTEQVLK
ncbi:p-aminobenzoyl-glutamate hydrolase subunit B [subsurface metagenome]